MTVVRKLYAKFHRVSLIRKSFKIGGNKSLTTEAEDVYYFWSSFGKLAYKLKLFEMRFSITYLYCPGESIDISGKELLRWKALQIDLPKSFFVKNWAVTAVVVARFF